MANWSEFEASAPELAAHRRALLFRSGVGDGLLSTVGGNSPPRIHPVNVAIVDGRLLLFVQPWSAKARDLAEDGRYALHAHQDPQRPSEFLLRGRGSIVSDATIRARAAESWPFTPRDEYLLLELRIDHALFGERPDPDAWPPRYTSWRPARQQGPG
jgi:Pyridoxamine 5'-phosphate oxidase